MTRKICFLTTCLLCAFLAIATARAARRLRNSKRAVTPGKFSFAVIYYTFTRGLSKEGAPLAQFFALDFSKMGEEQLAWLGKELTESRATWKIPFFHHPIYSSGRTYGSDLKLRADLEILFARYGIQVALIGHDHIYERIKPQQGVIYFVSGSGGQLRKGDIRRNDPLFAAGNDNVCHFMLFEVEADEMRFRAIDINGVAIDQGVISAKRNVNGQ